MGTGYHGGFGNTKGKKSEITYYSEGTEYEKVISSGMNFLEETISQTGIIAGSRTSIGTSSEKRKISRFELY